MLQRILMSNHKVSKKTYEKQIGYVSSFHRKLAVLNKKDQDSQVSIILGYVSVLYQQ